MTKFKITQQLKIAKKKDFLKSQAIDFLINELSLSEQEQLLKSRKGEFEEEYLERLEKKLYTFSLKRLLQEINSLGYDIKEIS